MGRASHISRDRRIRLQMSRMNRIRTHGSLRFRPSRDCGSFDSRTAGVTNPTLCGCVGLRAPQPNTDRRS
jgi:hypothetical protein